MSVPAEAVRLLDGLDELVTTRETRVFIDGIRTGLTLADLDDE
ncbi:hypothetical protein M2359_004593 [Gordonia amarae]|nr:hypothetical protein [Gordonia amarae]MCS3880964.1 hypothetical protein [Gordonia amarae]